MSLFRPNNNAINVIPLSLRVKRSNLFFLRDRHVASFLAMTPSIATSLATTLRSRLRLILAITLSLLSLIR